MQSSNSDDENHLNRRSSRPQSIASFSHPVSPSAAPIDDVRSSLDLQRESSPAGLLGHEGEGRKSKQFFGKIFKKKAARDLSPSMQSTHNRISPSSSFVSLDGVPPLNPGTNGYRPPIHAKAPLMNTTSNISEHAQGHHPVGHATFGTAPLIIRRRSSGTMVTAEGAVTGLTGPASLGLSLSNLSSASADQGAALPMLPSSRPVGYTWTVRKWAKKNTDGWAAQIVAAAASGLEMVNGTSIGGANDDVVFEWVKMRVPFSSVGSSITTRYSVAGSISDRTRSQSRGSSGLMLDSRAAASSSSRLPANLAPPRRSDSPLPPHSSPMSSPQLVARPEQMRRVSASTAPSSRRESASESEVTVEDGEDSDPEDSETPWACSIWVKKTGHRQLLGTLTPAPHHPKVIGILKIPVALGSVSLTDPQANKGHHHDMASRVREGVALTEENLKDVVCVTAMWLVAREEFGGLGRKRKV